MALGNGLTLDLVSRSIVSGNQVSRLEGITLVTDI